MEGRGWVGEPLCSTHTLRVGEWGVAGGELVVSTMRASCPPRSSHTHHHHHLTRHINPRGVQCACPHLPRPRPTPQLGHTPLMEAMNQVRSNRGGGARGRQLQPLHRTPSQCSQLSRHRLTLERRYDLGRRSMPIIDPPTGGERPKVASSHASIELASCGSRCINSLYWARSRPVWPVELSGGTHTESLASASCLSLRGTG